VADRFDLTRIPREVSAVARRLAEAGHEAWYVGGAVRDVLIDQVHGRHPGHHGDFDIATSARPEQVQALFRRTVPVGIEHGTVAVLDEKGRLHEVTTFRRDVTTDGRHAVVAFGVAIAEDLARRDFTINAIAVHPETGEMQDPFGGRADITARRIRAVGEAPARFREDWLRVLRALRFATTLGFMIDPPTWDAVRASAGELRHLSRERVRDEWMKTVAGHGVKAIELWREAGVLREVWPELAGLTADHDVRMHEVAGGDPVLITAVALAAAGNASDRSAEAVRRLRFSNADVERVRRTVAALHAALPPHRDRVAVRRWLSGLGEGAADVLAALPRSERQPLEATVAGIHRAHDPLRLGDLAVNGADLIAAGVPEGPAIGETLRRLLALVLEDPERNTRESLLAAARERA